LSAAVNLPAMDSHYRRFQMKPVSLEAHKKTGLLFSSQQAGFFMP
jgi:hypothetical protein